MGVGEQRQKQSQRMLDPGEAARRGDQVRVHWYGIIQPRCRIWHTGQDPRPLVWPLKACKKHHPTLSEVELPCGHGRQRGRHPSA